MNAPVPDGSDRLTYSESLAVMWLMIWRSVAFGGGIGFVIGFVLGVIGVLMGVDRTTSQFVISLLSFFVGMFIVGPVIVLPMMLHKKYSSFRLAIIRS